MTSDLLILKGLNIHLIPIFVKKHSIWFIFSLFGQFGLQFCKIAFNQVLLAYSVKIVNETVTTWNCLEYVSNFCSDVGTVHFYGRCRFKSEWNPIGEEIRVCRKSGASKKRVHNPFGNFEILFVRYVSSPFVFLLLL